MFFEAIKKRYFYLARLHTYCQHNLTHTNKICKNFTVSLVSSRSTASYFFFISLFMYKYESQQVGSKLIILRIWKKLSQPKSVQFWIPMGMPSWQVQKNLGVCLALWRLGGCLCLQKVGFLKVPFFTLKSGFLAILTPLLL